MSTLAALALTLLDRLLGVAVKLVEKRVNQPLPPKKPVPARPDHGGVTASEIDRLLQKATKDLN